MKELVRWQPDDAHSLALSLRRVKAQGFIDELDALADPPHHWNGHAVAKRGVPRRVLGASDGGGVVREALESFTLARGESPNASLRRRDGCSSSCPVFTGVSSDAAERMRHIAGDTDGL